MTRFLILYAAAAILFFPLDMLWLGVIARDFYRTQLGSLMLAEPRWGIAIVFYLVYLVGLVVFAMLPAGGSWLSAALYGALFGLVAYATYDLTNLATMRGFPQTMALVDIAWGAVLSAAAAGGGVALAGLVTDMR